MIGRIIVPTGTARNGLACGKTREQVFYLHKGVICHHPSSHLAKLDSDFLLSQDAGIKFFFT